MSGAEAGVSADAELLASVKRIAQYAAALDAQIAAQEETIDTLYRVVVSLDDFRAKLRLPFIPYRILLVLIRHSPAVVSHAELFTRVWGTRLIPTENLLRAQMKRLRDILAPHGVEIEGQYSFGYRLPTEALRRLKDVGWGAPAGGVG